MSAVRHDGQPEKPLVLFPAANGSLTCAIAPFPRRNRLGNGFDDLHRLGGDALSQDALEDGPIKLFDGQHAVAGQQLVDAPLIGQHASAAAIGGGRFALAAAL